MIRARNLIYATGVVAALGSVAYCGKRGCIPGTERYSERKADDFKDMVKNYIENNPCNIQDLSQLLEDNIKESYVKHQDSIKQRRYDKCLEKAHQSLESAVAQTLKNTKQEYQAGVYTKGVADVLNSLQNNPGAASPLLLPVLERMQAEGVKYSQEQLDAVYAVAIARLHENPQYVDRLLQEGLDNAPKQGYSAETQRALVGTFDKLAQKDIKVMESISPSVRNESCKGGVRKFIDRLLEKFVTEEGKPEQSQPQKEEN